MRCNRRPGGAARRVAPRRAALRRAALLRAVLLCAMALAAATASAQSLDAVPPQYLVVPFENSGGNGRVHWLTEASAIILTDDLQALGVAAISYEDRMRALDRLRVPPAGSLSHATTIRVAHLLGATHAIVGRFETDGDVLTVRARVIDIEAGQISVDVEESGPVSELFAIYAGIMRRVVPDAVMTLEDMERDHPPPAVFEQYVKGLLAQVPATRISYLTHARRLDPDFQRPRLALWRVYNELSEHSEALAVIQDLPEDHRLFRRAQFLAAISLLHLKRFDEAFDTWIALNLETPDPALYNNIGIVQLRREGDTADGSAVSYFGDALRLDGSDTDVLFNLGYAYFLDGELPLAIGWLRETVRRNPADAEAHYVLGTALQASGSAGEGARERDLARRLSATLAEFEDVNESGGVPADLERMKTDIDVPASLRLEHAIAEAGQRNQREAAGFHLDASRRLIAASRDNEAIAALQRAVYLSPYDSDAHMLLGELHLRAGRTADAIDALTIAIWSTDTVAARLALARAYLAADDAAAARAELEVVLSRQPQNAEARRLLGR